MMVEVTGILIESRIRISSQNFVPLRMRVIFYIIIENYIATIIFEL